MSGNLEKFIAENLDDAVIQRKKSSYTKQNYFDGYIQAMEEIKEFIENDE